MAQTNQDRLPTSDSQDQILRGLILSHWDLNDPQLKRQKIKRGGAVGGVGATIAFSTYMLLLKSGYAPEDEYIRGLLLAVLTWVCSVFVNVCRKARQRWPALKIFEVDDNNNGTEEIP